MSKQLSKIDSWNSGMSVREKTGGTAAVVGVGGLGLMGLAAMLPFISLPMLLVFMVIAGVVMAL